MDKYDSFLYLLFKLLFLNLLIYNYIINIYEVLIIVCKGIKCSNEKIRRNIV